MTIVAHAHPFVIGVDTHARTYTLAVVSASTGEQLACEQFPATAAGMKRAIDWAARRTVGDLSTLWAIEGIGTYGAKLARTTAEAGYPTVEAPRTNTRGRRGLGKSDPLDAQAIATAALSTDVTALRHPGQDDGTRAALRVLVAARVTFTRAARKVSPSRGSVSRIALLGSSPVDYVIALFVLRVSPLPCPVAYFTSLRKAMIWLRRDTELTT